MKLLNLKTAVMASVLLVSASGFAAGFVVDTPFDKTAGERCQFKYPAQFNEWESLATAYQEMYVVAGKLENRLSLVSDMQRELGSFRKEISYRQGNFHASTAASYEGLSVLDFAGQTSCESPYFDQVAAFIGNKSVSNITKKSFARTYNFIQGHYLQGLVSKYQEAVAGYEQGLLKVQADIASMDALLTSGHMPAITRYLDLRNQCFMTKCRYGEFSAAQLIQKLQDYRVARIAELARRSGNVEALKAEMTSLKGDLVRIDQLVQQTQGRAKTMLIKAGFEIYSGNQFNLEYFRD